MDNRNNVLERVQNVFIGKISQKNSWGKNEVIEAWKDSLLQVLIVKVRGSK